MLTLSATLRSARLACLARMGLHARAWLAVWFIVFASLSPTVTQALAAAQGPGHGLEICTSSSTRTLAPDGSLDLAADAGAPQGDGHPAPASLAPPPSNSASATGSRPITVSEPDCTTARGPGADPASATSCARAASNAWCWTRPGR